MRAFEGISFIWALTLVALIALIYGVRAFIGYRTVAKDAEIDFAYKSEQGMLDKRLDKPAYIRAYKRFHNPRSKAFVAGGLTAILVLTAPALLVIQIILEQLWLLNGQPRTFEPGFLVWQFIIFFSIIGIWAFIAYMTARQFHRHAPISLRDEILRELDQ